MWGRKAKRIRELEAQYADAIANLVHVTIQFPEPAKAQFRQSGARKGVWYRAEVTFRVNDDSQDLKNLGLYEVGLPPAYFDGSDDLRVTDNTEDHAFIRTTFINFHTEESSDGSWIPMTEKEAGERFDAWLAAHDAEVRATDREALADEIEAEQKRIASLPWSEKPWNGAEGRAWSFGMSNAIRMLREKAKGARDGK